MSGHKNAGANAGSRSVRAPATHALRKDGFVFGALIMLGLLGAGAASADSLALMSGGGQRGLGGSASAQPLVVEVRNVDGAVIAGRTINWSSSNGFVPSANSSVTDANGRASVNFTFGDYGTTNILASDPVGGTSMQAPETATGQDSITLISGGGQVGKSGTSSVQPIVVQILDASGHPVLGRTVNWSDQSAYTHVSAPTSTTNASGQASMGFTFLNGPQALSGTSGAIRATNSTDAQFVDATETQVGFASVDVISPNTLSGIQNSTSVPIVAKVLYADGTPVVGATVNWTNRVIAGSDAVVTPASATTVTDANGQTSNTVQYTSCGTTGGTGDVELTFGFSDFDVPYTITCTGSLTLLSPKPLSGPSGGATTSPMLVESHNLDGTIPVGGTMTWFTQSGDATPNATTSVINGSGQASMGFTVGTVASVVCATDPGTRTVCSPVNLTASETIRVVSGEGQVGTTNSPGAAPIVVEVLDSAGAPVVGRIVNWSQNPLDPMASVTLGAPTSSTNASGLAQMTFNYQLAGRTVITANDSSTGTGVLVRVAAVGMATFTVISGDNQSGLIGTHSAQPLVAELRDGAGNPVVGATVGWGTNSPLAGCALDSSTSITDANGRVSNGFTYSPTPGVCAWEAEDPTSRARAGFNVLGVGANSISLISGNGQTGQINTAGAQQLVVVVTDPDGSKPVGRVINWSTISGSATPNSTTSTTTIPQGYALMGFTYGATPSTSIIAATDSVTGKQVLFTVTGTQPDNHVVILSGDGQTGLPGTTGQPIVIEFRDPTSNLPLSGQTVIWSVASGPAALGAVTTSSDANGLVHANFNFGTTPGTSIIQATGAGGPTHGILQATVVTLGNNQSLSIVSGNNQTLIGGTTSAPLVVLLKDVNNTPVVGATIDWSATNGNLGAATSITDANGKASNTVSATGTAPVTVQANSTRASAPVTFTFSAGLVNLPGLTPAQTATATAIDNACPALANKPNLSPQEADLLAQCQALAASSGVNSGATVNALNQMISKSAQVQSTAASVAAVTQFQNINARLAVLRSGSAMGAQGGVSLSGLAFNNGSGVLPFGNLLNGFMSANDKTKDSASDAGFGKWGVFVTGTLGRGSAQPGTVTPAYRFDTDGLTFGVDYRKQDNWIFGAALGYSRQDTDLAQSLGHVGMTGYALSFYNTWTFHKIWYVDSVLTLGHNSFDQSRKIAYTLPLPNGTSVNVDQLATSHPGGSYREAAVTFGGDFHKDAWNFSPYGQLIWNRLGFDGYQETMLGGAGSGLGLAVDARSVTGLTSILGARVSFSHSANWGVIVPTASLEWNHEFKSDPQAISAQFIFDPTHTPIKIFGEQSDSDWLRMGVGLSAVFPRGHSAFLLYERTLARSGLSQYNISVGLRLEF